MIMVRKEVAFSCPARCSLLASIPVVVCGEVHERFYSPFDTMSGEKGESRT